MLLKRVSNNRLIILFLSIITSSFLVAPGFIGVSARMTIVDLTEMQPYLAGLPSVTDFPKKAITSFVVTADLIEDELQLLEMVGAYNVTIIYRCDKQEKIQAIYEAFENYSNCFIPEISFCQTLEPSEREMLIDRKFQDFKDVSGDFPSGIFSFQLDTYTLNYAVDRYALDFAVGNTWDQVNIDFMSLRGGFPLPYYASRHHNLVPAKTVDDASVLVVPPFAVSLTDRYHYDNNHIIDEYTHGIDFEEFEYISLQYPVLSPFFLELDWLIELNDPVLLNSFIESYSWVYGNFDVVSAQEFSTTFKSYFPVTPEYHFNYSSSNMTSFPETKGWNIEWLMNPDYRIARVDDKVISAINYNVQSDDPFLSSSQKIDFTGLRFGEDPNNMISTDLSFDIDNLWQSEYGDRTLTKTDYAIFTGHLKDFYIVKVEVNDESDVKNEWLAYAEIAWRYFENGVGVNSKTGLHHASKDWRRFTDWDLGTYIMAIIDAEKIGVLPKDGDWGADYRIQKIIDFLVTRQLSEDGLPYLMYDADTGGLPPEAGNLGETNVFDSGRLMVSLYHLKNHKPEHETLIDWIIHSKCNYTKLATNFPGGLNPEKYYIATGFSYFGFNNGRIQSALDSPQRMIDGPQLNIYNVSLPNVKLISEPILLAMFELDFSYVFKEIAYRTYLVQEKRWESIGIYTAFTEGAINGPPYYIYEYIILPPKTWLIKSLRYGEHSFTPIIYLKAGLGFHALFQSNYTESLIQYLMPQLITEYGFYDGVTEAEDIIYVLTDKTNSLIINAARTRIENIEPYSITTYTFRNETLQESEFPNLSISIDANVSTKQALFLSVIFFIVVFLVGIQKHWWKV